MAPRKVTAKAPTKAATKAPAPAAAPLSGPSERRSRRSPAPEDRLVDADRTRAALLEAALGEFSAKGYAGARVREIAARADVSKDLIAYHFGGKEGLYQAVHEAMATQIDAAPEPGAGALADRVVEALSDALIDRRPMRLMAWHGLMGAAGPDRVSDGGGESPVEATDDVRARQRTGELSDGLDPATIELVLLGAVAAPVIFPDAARRLFGIDPDRREFEIRYREGLVNLIAHLAPPPNR